MTRIAAAWITAPGPGAVFRALGGRAYFVGGCVRNSLFGHPVTDIDIATPLVPEEVADLLGAAGLKVVPTGLQHGTLTAVFDGEGIEVTTFRTDIETDGRHAVVRFTDDIELDAARRDFTMNALYADADGQVIDPLGGLPDLLARRVRFVGSPTRRIREDALRILRFFRFQALYGADGIDQEGLAACAALAEMVDGLARERVGWEFRKLLAAPDPAPAMASMAASGVLMRCLPGANPAGLAPLVDAEGRAEIAPDWITRLKSLGAVEVSERLKLSRAECAELARLSGALGEPRAEVAAYRNGRLAAERASLLRAAATGGDPRADAEAIARGARAEFPLSARDLLARDFEAGPRLGEALKAAEDAWIDSRFTLDRQALLSVLQAP